MRSQGVSDVSYLAHRDNCLAPRRLLYPKTKLNFHASAVQIIGIVGQEVFAFTTKAADKTETLRQVLVKGYRMCRKFVSSDYEAIHYISILSFIGCIILC